MQQKKIFVLLLLVLSLFVLVLGRRAWAEEKEILSVEKAIELAFDNNPLVGVAEKRVEQARARVREATASRAPVLSASALYQEVWKDPHYPVYIGGSATASGYALAGYRETWKTALTLSWLLYSSGSVENGIRASNLALEAVREESVRTIQAVEHAVRSAYYELQRSRAREAVAEEAMALVKEHYRQAESLYRNGIVAKKEILRAKVAVSESELNLIRAANAVDVTFRALERAVGKTLQGEYPMPDPMDEPPAAELLADPKERALLNRPELRALSFSERSAKAAAASASGSKGPSIFIQGEAFSAGQTFYPDAVDDWKITAVAEWKLYDGGKAGAKRDEALATAGELIHRMEDMRRQIALEVSVAELDLRSALQRLEVAKSQVDLAEEDYRMAVARYTSQVGTAVDVLDASVSLSASKNQMVDAVYDTRKAWADMMFAIGKNIQTQEDKR